MKRKAGGEGRGARAVWRFVFSALALAIVLGALLLPARDNVRAQGGDPTLDAAQMAIWQATRRAQQTREASDAQLAAQRATQAAVNAENTRAASDATRVYAATRGALDAYATRAAIDAQATRAAIETQATATAEKWKHDATRGAQTQTANTEQTRTAETRAAMQAAATMQAIQVQATRAAIERTAEYEARFNSASLALVFVLGAVVILFAAVAIRALARQPKTVVVEDARGERREAREPGSRDGEQGVEDIEIPPAPKTRVVLDPQAAQRITEILEFQETNENDDAHNDA